MKLDPNLKLSKDFKLKEFLASSTAARKGIPNIPTPEQFVNLVWTAFYMQQIRTYVDVPIVPSSVFRSSLLNDVIGGAKNSWHMKGLAADFIIPGYTVQETIDLIIELDLPYMELINEFGQWVHVAFAPLGTEPSRVLKIAKRINGKTTTEVIS